VSSLVSSQPQVEAFLSVDEFRKRLGPWRPGRNHIYAALNSDRIRHVRMGRRILILSSEVHDWPRREADRGQG
jgi:excisionase family DNA binding protein